MNNPLPEHQSKKPSGFGMAVGCICAGLCFFAFPKVVIMLPWLVWGFEGIGFLLFLFGLIGACSILLD